MAKKKVKKVEEPKKESRGELIAEREAKISRLREKLLTNEQLKRGGPEVRSRYAKESGFLAIVDEINEIGDKLGFPRVSLGGLRK